MKIKEKVKINKIITRKEKRKPSIYDKYKDLRQNRDKSKSVSLKDRVFKRVNLKGINKRLFKWKYIAPIIFILVIGLALIGARNLNTFNIQEIEVKANVTLDENSFDNLKERNIFSTSKTEIENEITSKVEGANSIYIRKILPNKLEIQLQVDEPYFISVFFNRGKVYSSELTYLKDINFTNLSLSSDEREILEGRGDLNGEYVKQKYILTLTEEEKLTFKWEDVPNEKKTEILEGLKQEIQTKINDYFTNASTKIPSEYSGLRVVNFYSDTVQGSDKDVENKLKFTDSIIRFLQEENLEVIKIEWYSKFFVRIELTNNKKFVFSIIRDIEEQKRDIESIIENNLLERGSEFDLRSENFSISN